MKNDFKVEKINESKLTKKLKNRDFFYREHFYLLRRLSLDWPSFSTASVLGSSPSLSALASLRSERNP